MRPSCCIHEPCSFRKIPLDLRPGHRLGQRHMMIFAVSLPIRCAPSLLIRNNLLNGTVPSRFSACPSACFIRYRILSFTILHTIPAMIITNGATEAKIEKIEKIEKTKGPYENCVGAPGPVLFVWIAASPTRSAMSVRATNAAPVAS